MSPALLRSAIEKGTIKTRADAGREYAIIIAAFIAGGAEHDLEIAALNGAIIKRWSARGLDWIKKAGWALYTAAAAS